VFAVPSLRDMLANQVLPHCRWSQP